jgi:hypothetical protein
VKYLIALLFSSLIVGCTTTKVEPWDKDLLSEEAMTFGANPIQKAYEQHTYFSKEATSGGSGFSGGGCGCN